MLIFAVKKKNTMKIGVFCSANSSIDQDFFTLTDELGRWMGREGHTLVYGGCNMGLMECVAKAVHETGGTVIGVIPRLLEQGGRLSQYIDVQIPCDNLSDRKDLMLAQADAFVVLPGGIGTLDELFTLAASATLGYHGKPLVVYDMKGFWQPLLRLLETLEAQGLVRGRFADYIKTARTHDEVVRLLEQM